MPEEIELKFIDIDKENIIRKIKALGAKQEYSTSLESVSFISDGFSSSDSTKKYLRLRKIGEKVFLTYKSPAKDSNLSIRDEYEIEVYDFDTMVQLFQGLGLRPTPLFKKHRDHFSLGEVHLEIDEVEGIPPYLEIEAPTGPILKETAERLGLDINKGKNKTIVEIYPDRFVPFD